MVRNNPARAAALAAEASVSDHAIRDIRLIALRHAFDPALAYGMARGLTSSRQTGIIVVELRNGVRGLGEAWGPPTVSAAYLDMIRDYFIGVEVFTHEHPVDLILSRHYHFGIQNQLMAVISGIDVAARDAAARALGVPLHALIGGARVDRVPVYASTGYITRLADADFAAQMEAVVGKGHRAVKIKIGRSPASDEYRVRTAREILGDDIDLMVDSNGNYTVDLALDSMRRIEKHRIAWYEEPLPPLDFRGYAELRARAPMPIATGEALYTAHDFHRLAEVRGADILQPDLSLCGGLGQARTPAPVAACLGVGGGACGGLPFRCCARGLSTQRQHPCPGAGGIRPGREPVARCDPEEAAAPRGRRDRASGRAGTGHRTGRGGAGGLHELTGGRVE